MVEPMPRWPWILIAGALLGGGLVDYACKSNIPDPIPRAECQHVVTELRRAWEQACAQREESAHQSGLAVCAREDDSASGG